MIAKITIVFLIALASGKALRCYTCLGSTSSDCQKDSSSSVVQKCDALLSDSKVLPGMSNLLYSKENIVAKCIEGTLIQGYESPYVVRSCGYIYENVDLCDYLSQLQPVISCRSCDGDLCNNRPIANSTNY